MADYAIQYVVLQKEASAYFTREIMQCLDSKILTDEQYETEKFCGSRGLLNSYLKTYIS
jgi:hypothetical protein